MEPVLKEINKKFVSLSDEEIKRNNNLLKAMLDLMIDKMKTKDTLFKEMYTRVFFGGSFYDGLRVGQPDEFDLDLLLALPKLLEPVITTSNVPGFVRLKFKEYIKFLNQHELALRYKGLDKLIDDKQYLDTGKVLRWMESVVNLALNEFEKKNNGYVLKTPYGILLAKICKGGPAFTLKVNGTINGKNVAMDVDLVPCFVFGKEKWPANGFRPNPPVTAKKAEYFIVPKPIPECSTNWRLSFQEQERVIIDSKATLKPSVRLLKKLRDNLDHKCIASYYIKTVVLWQAFEGRDEAFWNNSLSYVFMNLLKDYQKCLSEGKINYFWNKNNNLLAKIKKDTMGNLSNRIKAIIDDIDKHPENPFIVAKYLLNRSEYTQFSQGMSSSHELSLIMSRVKIT